MDIALNDPLFKDPMVLDGANKMLAAINASIEDDMNNGIPVDKIPEIVPTKIHGANPFAGLTDDQRCAAMILVILDVFDSCSHTGQGNRNTIRLC